MVTAYPFFWCRAMAPPQRYTKSAAWALITRTVFFSLMGLEYPLGSAAGRDRNGAYGLLPP